MSLASRLRRLGVWRFRSHRLVQVMRYLQSCLLQLGAITLTALIWPAACHTPPPPHFLYLALALILYRFGTGPGCLAICLTSASFLLHWVTPGSYFSTHLGDAVLRLISFAFASGWLLHLQHGRERFERERERLLVTNEAQLALADHLQAQLRDNNDRLTDMVRRKDHFLAQLAHELRGPIGSVLNAAEILERTFDDRDRQQRAIDIIRRQAGQQAALVEEIMEINRLREAKVSLKLSEVDLVQLIQTFAIDHGESIESSGLNLSLGLPKEAVIIQADETRLRQVLYNLVSNAAKFTDRGGEIRIGLCPGEDHSVKLEVSDTGIGIDSQDLGYIWDAFAQTDRAKSRNRGGLGLGLALVREIVELHGGQVACQSDGRNRGTHFTLTFPRPLRADAEFRS